jgi:hypothetical protein
VGKEKLNPEKCVKNERLRRKKMVTVNTISFDSGRG